MQLQISPPDHEQSEQVKETEQHEQLELEKQDRREQRNLKRQLRHIKKRSLAIDTFNVIAIIESVEISSYQLKLCDIEFLSRF